VGINVIDLQAAKAFFLDLGLEVIAEMSMEEGWVGRVIGLKDARSEIVMMASCFLV